MQGANSRFIHRYYIFQFLGNLAFFSPIIVLFWQANGLSMSQIMLLQAIYAIGVSILELPTGAFADMFGKKYSLFMGALFWAIGTLWYSQSHLFWQFAVGELTAGVGAAFISGADRAYLHELLLEQGRERMFSAVEGKARGIVQVAQAIASALGGVIAQFSLAGTLLGTSIANFINLFVVVSFSPIKKRESSRSFFVRIIESFALVRTHKALLWYVVFFATFFALIWPLQFYVQIYFQLARVPIYLFGVLFMGLNLLAGLAMTYTHKIESLLKDNLFKVMGAVVVVTLFSVMLFPHFIFIPFWSLFMMSVFILQTIISGRMLRIVPFEKTATVLSIQSLLRRIIYAGIVPFLGIATDKFGIRSGLIGYSLFMACILIILLSFQRRCIGEKV